MRELSDPFWIKTKAILFLLLGSMSAWLLIWERPTFKVAFLLTIMVWSFCRLYYFAFYVMQRYVDPTYRFSGVLSCLRYFALRQHKH